MIISYFFGRDWKNYALSGSKFKYRELIKKVRIRFYNDFNGETCISVQDKMFGKHFNMSDPDQKIEFESAGAHKDKCTHVVGIASKWLVEILLEEGVPLKQAVNY